MMMCLVMRIIWIWAILYTTSTQITTISGTSSSRATTDTSTPTPTTEKSSHASQSTRISNPTTIRTSSKTATTIKEKNETTSIQTSVQTHPMTTKPTLIPTENVTASPTEMNTSTTIGFSSSRNKRITSDIQTTVTTNETQPNQNATTQDISTTYESTTAQTSTTEIKDTKSVTEMAESITTEDVSTFAKRLITTQPLTSKNISPKTTANSTTKYSTTLNRTPTTEVIMTTTDNWTIEGFSTTFKNTTIKPSVSSTNTSSIKPHSNDTNISSTTPTSNNNETLAYTTESITKYGNTTTALFTTSESSEAAELYNATQPTLQTKTENTTNYLTTVIPTSTAPSTPITTVSNITTSLPLSTNPKEFNISVSIHSTPIIEGQNTGMIECSYIRNDTNKAPLVSWMKDNVMISNATFPFLTANQTCLNSTCNSTLVFQQIDILIKGIYMCIVREEIPGIHFTGEAKTEIRMKQKPALVIKPIRSSVTKGDSVTVNCYVSNKGEAYLRNNTDITICFANNNTNVPGCSGINPYNVTCTVTVVTNISFVCGLGNCTQSNQMSNFTVVNKGSKLCSSEADWPPTLERNEAYIPCPDGYSGLEARKCKSDGSWATEINRDGCKQKELENLENVLNITTKISATIVDSSLSAISNIVNKSNMASNNAGVLHNDIVQSVDIISQIASKNVTFSDHKTANKTTQVFMGIVSTLLETGKTLVKSAGKTKEKQVTSKILTSIDNFAKSVTGALQVNQSVIVRKPNMLVSIEKVPKGTDINFPREDNSDSATRFKLPQKALESLTEKAVSFTAVKYDNLGAEFISKNNTAIDSSVLSLTVDNLDSNNLQGNISLTFHRKNESRRPPECVFLSRSQDVISAWNTSGCSVENFTNSQVICSCNHLTNFAILLSLPDEVDIKALTGHFKALTLITFIGCGLSILGALTTIFIYLYFWRYLKSRRSVLVVNLCFALFIAYMLFLTAVEQTNDKVGCAVIAALLHYFFLAMFCIMLALGIDLAVAVLDVFNSRSSSAFLLLLSWGLPAAIVGITLGTTKTSGYGDDSYCWLRNNTLFGFIGPALGIILANLIVIIIVMRTIYSSAFMMKKSMKEKAKSGLRSICSLLPILGLTWVFGVLSIGEATIIFQYLFAICNSLQGLFIFLFHVVLNTQVRQAVSRKIKEYESKTLSTKSMSRSSRKLVSSKETMKSFEEFENTGSRTESTSFIIPRINASVSRRPGLFSSKR